MKKLLIMCADDYALSPSVDDGIIHLIKQGRLTATSCLVLSPRWNEAAKRITSEIRAQADIGLHLDFTQYPQTLKHSLGSLIIRTSLRTLSGKEIRKAIHHQLDCFESALGASPDYVDGHQHVHQLPQIRNALIETLGQRYKDQLPWIRIANPPAGSGFKAFVIRTLGANALSKLARQHGFESNRRLLGIYAFNEDATGYYEKLNGWLAAATSGDAFMCHPSINHNEIKDDPISTARKVEFDVLTDSRVAEILNKHQLVLSRYP